MMLMIKKTSKEKPLMTSRAHNKKRNTGLLYEFLVQTISRSLVEGDQKKSSAALKILRKHFKPGSALYNEFRLINALIKSTVSSDAVAGSIMAEAKTAARAYDKDALDREKSLLIRSINYSLNDDSFYDQQVNEYKIYATVQTLLNDWRDPDRDLGRLASYESTVAKWLVTEKKQPEEQTLNEESPGTSRLLMKVMMKKLNEKYSMALNDEQKGLIRAYAFATANDDHSVIKKKLAEIKEVLIESIDVYKSANPKDEYINSKLDNARVQLVSEDLIKVDDDTVTRFMLYTNLSTELGGE
jgi:hypothetical protein